MRVVTQNVYDGSVKDVVEYPLTASAFISIRPIVLSRMYFFSYIAP